MNRHRHLNSILLFFAKRSFFLFVAAFIGCEDFIEVETPKTQTTTATVYSSDITALSAVSGIYSEMVANKAFAGGGDGSVTMLAGLSSDEFYGYSASNGSLFQTNSLAPSTSEIKASLWEPAYRYIYYANSILEGLNNSTSVTEKTRNQIEGEAKFIRAFCHFYLVNLFGDIPLVTTTDYRINSAMPRISTETVYQQIIADLEQASNLLTEDYSFSNNERIRPNKWAATALLSRVYLYISDWSKAEALSSNVINNTALFSLVSDLNSVFLSNSPEAIWQLKPVEEGLNTNEAGIFVITSGTPFYVSLTEDLFNSFEDGDNRKLNWINSITSDNTYYYASKYKSNEYGQPLTEYSMVLRLAELYLIRAEARAQQGNLEGAITDLDVIRGRASLPLLVDTDPSVSKENLLLAIEQERRVEFFAEWGHRWFDLKRTNRSDAVLGAVKSISWQTTDALYPIPQSERNNNPKLSQNNGY